ncbi:MAG: hypothetical protein WEA79_11060, partial [Balneolaceae bacterium]
MKQHSNTLFCHLERTESSEGIHTISRKISGDARVNGLNNDLGARSKNNDLLCLLHGKRLKIKDSRFKIPCHPEHTCEGSLPLMERRLTPNRENNKAPLPCHLERTIASEGKESRTPKISGDARVNGLNNDLGARSKNNDLLCLLH